MADELLYQIIYPACDPLKTIPAHIDAQALRRMVGQISPLDVRLNLSLPPTKDLSTLAQQSSPLRFERGAVAARFLEAHPELGDAARFREAMEQDAGLGELVVMLDLLLDWTDRALAAQLDELTKQTGRIERAVDRLEDDPAAGPFLAGFHAADAERQRLSQRLRGKKRKGGSGPGGVG